VVWARCWRVLVASGASIPSVEAMKGWNDSRWVSHTNLYFCIHLLLKFFLWVLGSVGGGVKVGDSNIYNCIGSTFKESANGDVTAFLSVVGCGYLRGSLLGDQLRWLLCCCEWVVRSRGLWKECGKGLARW
jgi:hypothetical protein